MIEGHPLRIFPPHTVSDCAARESAGTSKKFQTGFEARPVADNHYIATTLERPGVQNRRGANLVDAGGFMDMARDADVGLHLLDKAACRRATDRLAADNTIALRRERRRMTHHQERTLIANRIVAAT